MKCPCGKMLDPKGDSLDWCGPGCQYRWMEQGLVPLPAPAPRPARPVMVPPTPAPVVLELPADAPRRVAAWRRIGRLRMGRNR